MAREEFDAEEKQKLGDSFAWEDFKDDNDIQTPVWECYEDEDEDKQPQVPDIDDADPDTYDQYVGAEVLLQKGDQVQSGRVVGRKRNRDGSLFRTSNVNPILDTRTYEVEFPDGEVHEYAANIIAENMYAQCDVEGNQFLLLNAIVVHKKDGHAVEKADMYIQAGSN